MPIQYLNNMAIFATDGVFRAIAVETIDERLKLFVIFVMRMAFLIVPKRVGCRSPDAYLYLRVALRKRVKVERIGLRGLAGRGSGVGVLR